MLMPVEVSLTATGKGVLQVSVARYGQDKLKIVSTKSVTRWETPTQHFTPAKQKSSLEADQTLRII